MAGLERHARDGGTTEQFVGQDGEHCERGRFAAIRARGRRVDLRVLVPEFPALRERVPGA
jgi:hypothetical protein